MFSKNYKRQPIELNEIINKNKNGLSLFFRICVNWNKIVGENLCLVSSPTMVLGNNLVVNVKNSMWIHQISFYKEEILSNLKKVTGSKYLSDLIFKQGSIQTIDKIVRQRISSELVTEEELTFTREKNESILNLIKDEEIKNDFTRLLAAYSKNLSSSYTGALNNQEEDQIAH
jgi:hypothetical protein